MPVAALEESVVEANPSPVEVDLSVLRDGVSYWVPHSLFWLKLFFCFDW